MFTYLPKYEPRYLAGKYKTSPPEALWMTIFMARVLILYEFLYRFCQLSFSPGNRFRGVAIKFRRKAITPKSSTKTNAASGERFHLSLRHCIYLSTPTLFPSHIHRRFIQYRLSEIALSRQSSISISAIMSGKFHRNDQFQVATNDRP